MKICVCVFLHLFLVLFLVLSLSLSFPLSFSPPPSLFPPRELELDLIFLCVFAAAPKPATALQGAVADLLGLGRADQASAAILLSAGEAS